MQAMTTFLWQLKKRKKKEAINFQLQRQKQYCRNDKAAYRSLPSAKLVAYLKAHPQCSRTERPLERGLTAVSSESDFLQLPVDDEKETKETEADRSAWCMAVAADRSASVPLSLALSLELMELPPDLSCFAAAKVTLSLPVKCTHWCFTATAKCVQLCKIRYCSCSRSLAFAEF